MKSDNIKKDQTISSVTNIAEAIDILHKYYGDMEISEILSLDEQEVFNMAMEVLKARSKSTSGLPDEGRETKNSR